MAWSSSAFSSLGFLPQGRPLPSEPTLVNPWEQVTGDIYGFFSAQRRQYGERTRLRSTITTMRQAFTREIFTANATLMRSKTSATGNDIQIYGDKLWAVINCSNYVEVMDVNTAKHITKIAIPNCRYLAFKDKHACERLCRPRTDSTGCPDRICGQNRYGKPSGRR